MQFRRASARQTANFTVATQTSSEDFARDAFGLGESHEWRLKFSAIYRLQDTARLKGILRKIFG